MWGEPTTIGMDILVMPSGRSCLSDKLTPLFKPPHEAVQWKKFWNKIHAWFHNQLPIIKAPSTHLVTCYCDAISCLKQLCCIIIETPNNQRQLLVASQFCNPDQIRNFFMNSISNWYPKIKNYGLWHPIQIRNTLANICRSVYFASRGKAVLRLYCHYSDTIFVVVVIWQGRYIKRKLLAFWMNIRT